MTGAVPQWSEQRKAVLDHINEARSQHGLAPFRFDPILERVGDQHCRDLIVLGGRGHFSCEGTPPYLRYFLAGGSGYHRENVSSYDSTLPVGREAVLSILLNSVDAMLAEVPPADGHRRTLLDPTSTLIGVGVVVEDGSVRMAHEVATGMVTVERRPPPVVTPLQTVEFKGRVARPWVVTAVEVLWQAVPEAKSLAEAESIGSYRYPPRRSMTRASDRKTGSTAETLWSDGRGTFSFRWRTGPENGVEVAVVWGAAGTARSLTPLAATATVVTGEDHLPASLLRWRALAPPRP